MSVQKTTTNLETLKINYLTQQMYEDALENNEINENELYFTPDEDTTSLSIQRVDWTDDPITVGVTIDPYDAPETYEIGDTISLYLHTTNNTSNNIATVSVVGYETEDLTSEIDEFDYESLASNSTQSEQVGATVLENHIKQGYVFYGGVASYTVNGNTYQTKGGIRVTNIDAPRPELTITFTKTAPSGDVVLNQDVTLNVTYTNTGNLTISKGGIIVDWLTDESSVYTFSNLSPGNNASQSITFQPTVAYSTDQGDVVRTRIRGYLNCTGSDTLDLDGSGVFDMDDFDIYRYPSVYDHPELEGVVGYSDTSYTDFPVAS